MDERDTPNLQSSYDRVAKEYVERIFNELDDKPLDRSLLDRFAERVKDKGPACDLGCGPGHVARYLKNNDIEIFGIDLSDGMVQQARTMNPDIEFHQGDMMALELADQTLSGIAAFYSIIHIPRHAVVDALIEMKRVLQIGGLLLLAFHIGQETIHRDEWWGHEVCLDFLLFNTSEMTGYLTSAGFAIEEVVEREPYAEVEYASRRAYIFARRPADASN